MQHRERVALCRSWLFLPGADRAALEAGPASGADVLIQELEDSVPPARRPEARDLTADVLEGWRRAGIVAAVRVNPLESDGLEDLAAIMPAAPDVVMLPKCATRGQVAALDREVTALERRHGLREGSTLLVPNVESAVGLRNTFDIATASPRVIGCLVASEDLAADLGAIREPDGMELVHARSQFHVDCVAAGVLSIDCPYTFADEAGLAAELQFARRLGYRAKSAVAHRHVAIINSTLTPSASDLAQAQELVSAFEDGMARGLQHGEHHRTLVELPTYLNARRTIARSQALQALERSTTDVP